MSRNALRPVGPGPFGRVVASRTPDRRPARRGLGPWRRLPFAGTDYGRDACVYRGHAVRLAAESIAVVLFDSCSSSKSRSRPPPMAPPRRGRDHLFGVARATRRARSRSAHARKKPREHGWTRNTHRQPFVRSARVHDLGTSVGSRRSPLPSGPVEGAPRGPAPPTARSRPDARFRRQLAAGGRLAVSYWKVIMSVRLSVVAFGFKGSFAKFALPEFKTL
jgi:hypothetical protein